MKILVINAGSSSIKYELFDMDHHTVIAQGMAEKIGEETGILTHKRITSSGDTIKKEIKDKINDHHQVLTHIVELLVDPETGVIQDKSQITAVGHRVVHGGESFHSPTVIDTRVMAAIRENIPLAPLHNPPNLEGIEVTRKIFPNSPQVAVFDTAFHQTIPEHAFLYAIPYRLYEKEKVRRYGFHGTSHAYVAEKAAAYLERPLTRLNLITIHLGNGASMAAIKNGRSIDTTMGMTPLEGLMMGTRSGDLDPAIPFFLADYLGMSLKEIDTLLNKESGLKGICGINDMREILARKKAGDRLADIAISIYTYRIKKYIGAFYAALGILDGIVFTAGIGENASEIREGACSGLENLGIEIDLQKNESKERETRDISTQGCRVKVLVIPTNEELKIALETQAVIEEKLKAQSGRRKAEGGRRILHAPFGTLKIY